MPVSMVCCEKQLHYEYKGKYTEKKGERSLKRRQKKFIEIRNQENSLKKGKKRKPVKSEDWACLSIGTNTSYRAC